MDTARADGDLFGFSARALSDDVTEYASGVLSPAIMRGFTRAGAPICVPAADMGAASVERVAAYASQGGAVLIDSGAFAYRDCPGAMPWEHVLGVYQAVLRAATGPVTVILPDAVGDQDASLAALRAHGSDVLAMVCGGHRALLPLPTGAMSARLYVRAAVQACGGLPHGIALPSRVEAFPPEALADLAHLPAGMARRVHFLGVGRDSARLAERLVRLDAVWPDAEVSCDACLHRAKIGAGREITQGRKAHLHERVDTALETWDDTEDDDAWVDAMAVVRDLCGGELDDEALDDLMACDMTAHFATLSARHRFENEHGPAATEAAIHDYARGRRSSDAFDS